MDNTIRVCDFPRSFVRWGIDTTLIKPATVTHEPPFTLNDVRVLLDCIVEVTDRATGRSTLHSLGASCKTERVNVQSDIWTQPNADFCMVTGPDAWMGLKRWDRTEKGVLLHPPSLGVQPERQLVDPKKAFSSWSVDVRRVPARRLETIADIAAALASDSPAVSRTRIEGRHCSVVIEYPVVTANFSTRDRYYQLDTGPVLFPDADATASGMLETFNLAFVAHARPDWAEFLVSVPTAVGSGISVHHFSKSVRVTCTNEMFVVL